MPLSKKEEMRTMSPLIYLFLLVLRIYQRCYDLEVSPVINRACSFTYEPNVPGATRISVDTY